MDENNNFETGSTSQGTTSQTSFDTGFESTSGTYSSTYQTTGTTTTTAAPKSESKALEICALVFGILGIVCCVCYGLFGVIGLVLSIICLATGKKSGFSIAGLVCSILGIILTIVMIAVGVNSESIINKLEGTSETPDIEITTEEDIIIDDDIDPDVEDTEEESTEKTTTEAAVNNASSDDWTTGEMTINGTVIKVPCTFADIEALGFKLEDSDASEELEANHYTTTCYAENDEGQTIGIRFSNDTDETLPITECSVYGVSFDDWYDLPSIVLCNGISIGMSKDDVVAIMGTPDYEYEGEGDSTYSSQEWYIDKDYSYYGSLDITYDDGVVSEITFEHLYNEN